MSLFIPQGFTLLFFLAQKFFSSQNISSNNKDNNKSNDSNNKSDTSNYDPLSFFKRHLKFKSPQNNINTNQDKGTETKFLFIAGYSSNSGKSSICMSLLDILQSEYEISPSELAYIKPATQCTATQGIWKYCKEKGIDYVGLGPLLYYTGYTAERQETEDVNTSEIEVLEMVKDSIMKCGKGKRFVLVDGVGYPSVGSIVGASNASIASYLGFPVLLVGKDGLGDAIDTFNLNRIYFEVHGAKVLGCIFNRVTDIPYSDKYVNLYLKRHQLPYKAYGFLPVLKQNVEKLFQRCCGKGDVCSIVPPSQRGLNISNEEREVFDEMNTNFRTYVNWEELLKDIAFYYNSKSI